MNNSNFLAESAETPLFLCPDCLRKPRRNIGFDVAARYEGMQRFLREEGFIAERSGSG